ncbi:vesicular inhibitory amino acid transporter-like [Oculina patagonica]
MGMTYQPLKSEKIDEVDETEIITLLQSSDAESSSDDEVTHPLNNKESHDPSTGELSSVWKTAANLVNYIEGIGFLAVPYALKEGGVAAIVAFTIIPIILWYMGTILTECLYDEDDQGTKHRVRSGYRDLGDALVPKYGGYIISGVMLLDVFLLTVSYLVLFGSVMHHTLPSVPITEVTWIGIAGGLVLPTTFLKSLSQIAWLSVISVFALAAVVVSVVWYGAEHTNEWDLSTILFWDTEGVIMSLSIILYSYGAYVLIPTIEKSMADKAKFGKALALAYLVSVFLKLSFSVCAFLSFGFNTDAVIINNLPLGTVHIAVGSFFALNCILSYALAIYPLVEALHNSVSIHITNDKVPGYLTDAVVRVTALFMTVVVAIFVPNFSIIVSFMGSTVFSLSGYIFPFVLHLKLKYRQLKIYKVCINSVLIFFGVIVTIFGTAVSIKTLIKFYGH